MRFSHFYSCNIRFLRVCSILETDKANELEPLKNLMFLLENRLSAEMSDEGKRSIVGTMSKISLR